MLLVTQNIDLSFVRQNMLVRFDTPCKCTPLQLSLPWCPPLGVLVDLPLSWTCRPDSLYPAGLDLLRAAAVDTYVIPVLLCAVLKLLQV